MYRINLDVNAWVASLHKLLAPYWVAQRPATNPEQPRRKKPASVVYGLEEVPAPAVIWISAVQHVGVIAIFMIYPLIIAHAANMPADQLISMLQWGLIVLAIANLLQALSRGPVGSRLLAPSIFTGVYLAPSLLALKAGGLPLLWGMTIVAGLTEMGLSRVWSRLRPFIPPESAGLVVFLVGVIIGLAAVHLLLEDTGALSGRESLVAAVAFAVMVGLNVWNKGRLRLFCILIGMLAGYVVAAGVGLLTAHDAASVFGRPLFALPHFAYVSWSFDWEMVVPFMVTGLAAAMSATAVITSYQRITDAEWVRPDLVSISRGVLGDGIAAVVAGFFGTYGLTVSTANVGLVAATGVASRIIAGAVAALLVLAAFQPTVLGLLTIMPRPVMAAAMIFTAMFIMISGLQIISSRVLDSRRTLVIGMGLLAFVMVSVYPNAFAQVPAWAQPLVMSPLVLATLVALGLNLLFRIGIRRTVQMQIDPIRPDVEAVTNFIERNAGLWGARRDVINRVEFAVQQTVETIIGSCGVKYPIQLEVSYDEFDVDAVLTYAGATLEFPDQAPTVDEIIDTEAGARRLAGFLIKSHADRMTATRVGPASIVRLHFEH
jgi:NCS2 family nucleobase:cation symporter-2